MEWRRLIPRRRYVPPEEVAYRRLLAKGYRPASIIDVGADVGEWTRIARRVWPDTPALMVEARPHRLPRLRRVCEDLADVRAVTALLAARPDEERTFFWMGSGSSLFPERSDTERSAGKLVTRTLDQVAADVAGPLFLKLDVQGAEIEVLAGGQDTLARADLVQLELPLVPYNEGAPDMLEALRYMADRGFAPLDISSFCRPDGVDLAQVDMLFVPASSPLRRQFFAFRN